MNQKNNIYITVPCHDSFHDDGCSTRVCRASRVHCADCFGGQNDRFPGDTITYTITMGAVSDLGSIQMVLDIPAGLTYVSGSGALAPGLKAKLGFDDISFTENAATGRCIINGAASAADYASTADTVIATFRCTVNADATGVQELGLTELEFVSCRTFEEITSNFSVVKAAVTVSGATPPVTAFTVSFAANGGTGDDGGRHRCPRGRIYAPRVQVYASG